MRRTRLVALSLSLVATDRLDLGPAIADRLTTYQLPPKAIVDILDARAAADDRAEPDARHRWRCIERASMPPLRELAQPVLRLAGRRINPRTNGPHRAQVSRVDHAQVDRRRQRRRRSRCRRIPR